MAYSRFDSESAWREGVRQVIAHASHELRLLDADLKKMKLAEPGTVSALEQFLATGPTRRIHIAVHNPQPLLHEMPRLVRLAQRYAHVFLFRHIPETYGHLADCHVLADAHHGVRRFHIDHARGALLMDEKMDIAPWWRRFDELWSESLPVSLGPLTGL